MTIDMTWERREELIRKEEREEGFAEGREEGREVGREEGREEGRAEGSREEAERINRLNQCLIQADRIADLKRASEDREFQLELFEEFGL